MCSAHGESDSVTNISSDAAKPRPHKQNVQPFPDMLHYAHVAHRGHVLLRCEHGMRLVLRLFLAYQVSGIMMIRHADAAQALAMHWCNWLWLVQNIVHFLPVAVLLRLR